MSLNTDSLAFAYYLSEWAVRLAMTVIIPFRRTPDASRGWLLLVFFLPWPALLLYLLIGRPTYPAWRRERFLRLPHVLQISAEQLSRITNATEPPLPARLASAAKLVQNLGRLPVVGGCHADLLADYEGMVKRLVEDIDAASTDVHLQFYIFANDSTGRQVIEALIRAAQRRVDCRLLIDALGSRPWADSIVALLRPAGVNVQLMLPVGFVRRRSARADLRNHRKVAVIDGCIGYAGSQNIVDIDFHAGIRNHELMVRVTGPVVLELQAVFIADWFLETEEVLPVDELLRPAKPTGDVTAQVLPSGPDYPGAGIENLIVALIHGAQERVVIATPYFVPSEPLLNAMHTAVLRGVRVHLIVSRVTDHALVKLAQRSYYAQLMSIGVRVRLYGEALLHAKNILIDDDLAVIGSSNVDIRSFVLNSEVTLVFYDREVTARLADEHQNYFAHSRLLSPSEWQARPLPMKIAENLARMLGPLL